MSSPLTIRPMRADDDLDAEIDLRHRAFGPMGGAEREHWRNEMLARIAAGEQYGVWDRQSGGLIGTARYYDMRQYWHGKPVPMAGVGGVKVAPEARGRGVGRALMAEVVGVLAGRGYALSVLFPATAQIYRSLGWELAGARYRIEVPGRSLASLVRPDPQVPGRPGEAAEPGKAAGPGAAPRSAAADAAPLRRVTPDDAEEVTAVLGAVHAAARDCGPATRDAASVRRWLCDPDLFGYLAPDGFLGYGWHGHGDHEIIVSVLAAASADTARTLWGIVASHASTRVVHAVVGPADPIGWLTREPDVKLRRDRQWMLRVLDPAAAIAGRGFPAGARAAVTLRLADPALPGNAGVYALEVADGSGSLLSVATSSGATARDGGSHGAEPVAFGPRGFAALYAGVPMTTLRAAGLAAGGDPGSDAALDAAFTSQPYLLDYF